MAGQKVVRFEASWWKTQWFMSKSVLVVGVYMSEKREEEEDMCCCFYFYSIISRMWWWVSIWSDGMISQSHRRQLLPPNMHITQRILKHCMEEIQCSCETSRDK